MLAFEKPAGTLVQFRYSTIPDPGYAIINVIGSRAEQGTHTLASLLQASNLEYIESGAKHIASAIPRLLSSLAVLQRPDLQLVIPALVVAEAASCSASLSAVSTFNVLTIEDRIFDSSP